VNFVWCTGKFSSVRRQGGLVRRIQLPRARPFRSARTPRKGKLVLHASYEAARKGFCRRYSQRPALACSLRSAAREFLSANAIAFRASHLAALNQDSRAAVALADRCQSSLDHRLRGIRRINPCKLSHSSPKASATENASAPATPAKSITWFTVPPSLQSNRSRMAEASIIASRHPPHCTPSAALYLLSRKDLVAFAHMNA
jgi:hypothetical protein